MTARDGAGTPRTIEDQLSLAVGQIDSTDVDVRCQSYFFLRRYVLKGYVPASPELRIDHLLNRVPIDKFVRDLVNVGVRLRRAVVGALAAIASHCTSDTLQRRLVNEAFPLVDKKFVRDKFVATDFYNDSVDVLRMCCLWEPACRDKLVENGILKRMNDILSVESELVLSRKLWLNCGPFCRLLSVLFSGDDRAEARNTHFEACMDVLEACMVLSWKASVVRYERVLVRALAGVRYERVVALAGNYCLKACMTIAPGDEALQDEFYTRLGDANLTEHLLIALQTTPQRADRAGEIEALIEFLDFLVRVRNFNMFETEFVEVSFVLRAIAFLARNGATRDVRKATTYLRLVRSIFEGLIRLNAYDQRRGSISTALMLFGDRVEPTEGVLSLVLRYYKVPESAASPGNSHSKDAKTIVTFIFDKCLGQLSNNINRCLKANDITGIRQVLHLCIVLINEAPRNMPAYGNKLFNKADNLNLEASLEPLLKHENDEIRSLAIRLHDLYWQIRPSGGGAGGRGVRRPLGLNEGFDTSEIGVYSPAMRYRPPIQRPRDDDDDDEDYRNETQAPLHPGNDGNYDEGVADMNGEAR